MASATVRDSGNAMIPRPLVRRHRRDATSGKSAAGSAQHKATALAILADAALKAKTPTGDGGAGPNLCFEHLRKSGGSFVRAVLLGAKQSSGSNVPRSSRPGVLNLTISREQQRLCRLDQSGDGNDGAKSADGDDGNDDDSGGVGRNNVASIGTSGAKSSNSDRGNGAPFVVAAVRDACSWYVSLWNYGHFNPQSRLFRTFSPQERKEYYTNSSDITAFRSWLRRLTRIGGSFGAYSHYHAFKLGHGKRVFYGRRDLDASTYSKEDDDAVRALTTDGVCFVRHKTLVADLVDCLQAFGREHGGRVDWTVIHTAVSGRAKANSAPHRPCADYYDRESLREVYWHDGQVQNLLGLKCCE